MGVSDGNVPGGYVVNPAYVQQQQQAAAAPQAAPSTASAGQGGGGMTMQQMLASFTPIQQQWWAGAPASEKQQAMNTYGVGAAAAAPQAAPQAAPNSWQNTMAMLANPGKVTTRGATVPAGPSAQPGPGALQAFLQNYKPTQSGPGAGFQNSFAGTLKELGY